MCSETAAGVQRPWLRVVGIGADGWCGLSPAARQLVESAEYVIGGERHLASLPTIVDQQRESWPSPLTDAFERIVAWRGMPVCVLASGDPFWYGVGASLARYIDAAEMEVVPAPSAYALAAARMGWPLQETACVSAHGRALERVVPELHDRSRLLLLSWDGSTAAALAQLLTVRGFGRSRLTVLEHLGAPEEARYEGLAVEWGGVRTADLNTIALDCVADAEATVVTAVAGRADALFEHQGQITKREIRAITLALLGPGRGERLWDIGAGSGSVGIEWMLSHPSNRAIAIEPRPDRIDLIQANARALGAPDLECVQGQAPAALAGLAPPDAVFIGGGLTTPQLLSTCWQALQAGGRLVANSVTVEGDAVLAEAMERYGGDLTRIGVTRAEPLGGFTGWAPARPVTTWQARK